MNHYLCTMLPNLILLTLIIQSSITFAHQDEDVINRDVLKNHIDLDDDVIKDYHQAKKDWIDMFVLPHNGGIHPTSSVSMMEQATKSNKSLEDQLEEIKEMANKITMAIQSEMANLLSYALCNEKDENGTRKRRSVESPMDSTQLVMRLLKHIKANNEYQNIAIEKMMTAQEIADKYGIEFDPDTEVLSDLAIAANNQALELTDILKEACDGKNTTTEHVSFVPVGEKHSKQRDSYYMYGVDYENPQQKNHDHSPFAPYEYVPEKVHYNPAKHTYYSQPVHHHHHQPSTSPPFPIYSAPVTPKPNYYDSMMAFAPSQETFLPYCSFEPVTTTTTIVFPVEEPVEPEPVITGEEYEETISSKIIVDHDSEPGAGTVNHVMTYTLSEKAHFKTPEIEKLPEQMQYTFFLM